uniref:Uncharacterized protein n=1 Tax=Timema shepardi TaxID=629360 RepID=A0A7R9AXQ7_TIMSH|nr:unnamed protein product [Timema shepardi]
MRFGSCAMSSATCLQFTSLNSTSLCAWYIHLVRGLPIEGIGKVDRNIEKEQTQYGFYNEKNNTVHTSHRCQWTKRINILTMDSNSYSHQHVLGTFHNFPIDAQKVGSLHILHFVIVATAATRRNTCQQHGLDEVGGWGWRKRDICVIGGSEWRKLKRRGICRTKTSRLSCTQDLSQADEVPFRPTSIKSSHPLALVMPVRTLLSRNEILPAPMDHPELLFEEARLKTFGNWPYNNDAACSPEKMAEAGFYACGSTEDPDEARKEHKSHAPKCMFVKFGKKESELTVYQIYDLDLERLINGLYVYAIFLTPSLPIIRTKFLDTTGLRSIVNYRINLDIVTRTIFFSRQAPVVFPNIN